MRSLSACLGSVRLQVFIISANLCYKVTQHGQNQRKRKRVFSQQFTVLVLCTGKNTQFSTQELLWLIFGFWNIHNSYKPRHGISMDFVWIFTHDFWYPQNNHIWLAIFHVTCGNLNFHVWIWNFPFTDCVSWATHGFTNFHIYFGYQVFHIVTTWKT